MSSEQKEGELIMGMCASQGRLLTLTSLKSDCELQAQKINNDRETLSRAEEKLMTEYTNAINNKKLLVKQSDGKDDVKLTAQAIFDAGYYIVIDGEICEKVSDLDQKYRSTKVGEKDNPLQFALLNGQAQLVKKGESVSQKKDYSAVSIIVEDYDETDDAQAKAKYDLELKKVQRKDKTLELQLDQIETRHKAYETEIDSVQKVINSNIEGSFKTFNQG